MYDFEDVLASVAKIADAQTQTNDAMQTIIKIVMPMGAITMGAVQAVVELTSILKAKGVLSDSEAAHISVPLDGVWRNVPADHWAHGLLETQIARLRGETGQPH